MKLLALPTTILLAVASSAPSLASDFLLVDGSGAGDYRSLASAYAAANDGDTLYVLSRPMDASQDLTFDGKGITLVYQGPSALVEFRLLLKNLPSTSHFLLRGPTTLSASMTIRAEDCDGTIILSDLFLDDSYLTPYFLFQFDHCASVTLKRTLVSGNFGNITHSTGQALVCATATNLIVEDSDLVGLVGLPGFNIGGLCMDCCVGGGPGTLAIEASDSSLIIARRSHLIGGDGGLYPGGNLCFDGENAPAIRLDSTSTVVLLESTSSATAPDEGDVRDFPGSARTMHVPASVGASGTLTLELLGENGDTAFLFGGGDLVSRPFGLEQGFLQVSGAGRRRLGTVGATGVLNVDLSVPSVPALTTYSFPLQVVYLTSTGDLRFAPASVVDVVGAGLPTW